MARIGFIGLGHMGAPMARNLLKAGHTLKVFDLDSAAMAALTEAGAHAAADVAALVHGADAVVSMLPAGAHVEAAYGGDDGVIARAAAGTLVIDSSTIDVATARRLAARAADRGLALVDAPVSGGVAGAAAGTLTFMVGGEAPDFARARPILKAMGANIFHAGGAGNGQAAKICNNMLLGISMIGTAEAFTLAEKLGLDAQTFFDIASTASGQCWSMTSYCPVAGPVPTSPANNAYAPGFTAAMMLKDLRLAQEAAAHARAPAPLGSEAAALYGLMEAAGKDGLDFSAIIQLLRGDL